MPHVTNRTWMPAQVEELKRLVEAGASPLKAATRLKRSTIAVQIKAKDLGCPFVDKRVLKRRRLMRESEVRRKLGLA
jgi:GcrA cell cycle regulator